MDSVLNDCHMDALYGEKVFMTSCKRSVVSQTDKLIVYEILVVSIIKYKIGITKSYEPIC